MRDIVITPAGDALCPFCGARCPAPANDDNHYCPNCGALYLEEDEACLSDACERAQEYFGTEELEIVGQDYYTEYDTPAELEDGDPTTGHKIYLQFFRPAETEEPGAA